MLPVAVRVSHGDLVARLRRLRGELRRERGGRARVPGGQRLARESMRRTYVVLGLDSSARAPVFI
jgi:hypothetical protein